MNNNIERESSLQTCANPKLVSRLKFWASTMIGAAMMSCAPISKQPDTTLPIITPTKEMIPDTITEAQVSDIDNPIFITLVGVSAELQSELEFNEESRSLQYIWEVVTKKLNENNIFGKASVNLMNPTQDGRGFAYILLSCDGQEFPIVAPSKEVAHERISDIQHAFEAHINERVTSLSINLSITKIHEIVKSEKQGFSSHKQKLSVNENRDGTITLEFESEI